MGFFMKICYRHEGYQITTTDAFSVLPWYRLLPANDAAIVNGVAFSQGGMDKGHVALKKS